jgi:carboxypeptidase PM20D1
MKLPIRRVTALLSVVVLLVAAIVALRTLAVDRPAPNPPWSEQLPGVDTAVAAMHLGEAIRIQTVSLDEQPMAAAAAFAELRTWLAATYPRFHSVARSTVVADATLVYEWTGLDSSLEPIVLMAHQDVVPALDPELWKYPPFSGALADEAVWGRGSIDDKSSLVALMEALESLAHAGYAPARSIFVVFGHDEETTGFGASAAAEWLQGRGVHAAFVLDEGSLVVEDHPVTRGPVGLVGISEKGFVTLAVTAQTAGGHSSAPPADTAVEVLSRAVLAIIDAPFPRRYDGPTRQMLEALAPHAPLVTRMAIANSWLFEPVLLGQLGASPQGAAMVQTTIAPTMLQASPKENVLAASAEALVNYRIAPGDSIDSVLAEARAATRDFGVEVKLVGTSHEPSAVSSVESEGYALIAGTAQSLFDVPVVPSLVIAATDSRHMDLVSDNIYRFQPIRLTLEETGMLHGIDEHLRFEQLEQMIDFYQSVITKGATRGAE